MATKVVGSEQARSEWRDLIDMALAGDTVVVERYGKPSVAVISYKDYLLFKKYMETGQVSGERLREEAAGYTTERSWQEVKAELLAELRAELAGETDTGKQWATEVRALRQQIEAAGGLIVGNTKEEIVARLRRTRQEIFEAEYAHLYR